MEHSQFSIEFHEKVAAEHRKYLTELLGPEGNVDQLSDDEVNTRLAQFFGEIQEKFPVGSTIVIQQSGKTVTAVIANYYKPQSGLDNRLFVYLKGSSTPHPLRVLLAATKESEIDESMVRLEELRGRVKKLVEQEVSQFPVDISRAVPRTVIAVINALKKRKNLEDADDSQIQELILRQRKKTY